MGPRSSIHHIVSTAIESPLPTSPRSSLRHFTSRQQSLRSKKHRCSYLRRFCISISIDGTHSVYCIDERYDVWPHSRISTISTHVSSPGYCTWCCLVPLSAKQRQHARTSTPCNASRLLMPTATFSPKRCRAHTIDDRSTAQQSHRPTSAILLFALHPHQLPTIDYRREDAARTPVTMKEQE